MNKRTIMIFPQFDNMHSIKAFRKKHDPLYGLVRPHITLVFPFESGYSQTEIEAALAQALAEVPPFAIELKGLMQDRQWIFLDVTQGRDTIVEIHKNLYAKHFSQYRPSWLQEYTPHVTVGQFKSSLEAQNVYETENHLTESFTCVVQAISVEIIGENEESILETEYQLRQLN